MGFDVLEKVDRQWCAIFGPGLELRSPLTPDQCCDRLRQSTDPLWKLFGSKAVLGNVRGQKFSGYKRIYYGNSFRTFVFARIIPDAKGSLISLRFGISPFTTAIFAFWWTGLILIGGFMFIYAAKTLILGNAPEGTWKFLVVPTLMAAFGVGLFKFCRWLGRNERPFLIDFIKTILMAS
jgi:hypothetical protein